MTSEYLGLLLQIILLIDCAYGSTDTLGKIHRDFWVWRMEESPWFMTTTGINQYNDRLESYNISKFHERKETTEDFYNRVKQLDTETLSESDRIEYDIFMDYLNTFIEGYEWRNYLALNPVNFLEGLQTRPQFLAQSSPFNSQGDHLNFLIRLKKIPTQAEELLERLQHAIQHNHTNHKVSLLNVPKQINKFITANATDLVFYKSFVKQLEQMADIPGDLKRKWKTEAAEYCQQIIDAWTKLRNFMETEYMQNTRKGYGVGSWTNGKAFYRACLKWHISIDMSPEEVFNLGKQEVDRIQGNMKKVMTKLGFTGSIKEFFDKQKADTSMSKASENEVLEEYKRILRERIKPVLPKYFNDIPDLPMSIEKQPFDGPGALYSTGSSDGLRPATFYVNTRRPTSNPVFSFMPLAIHEAEPGHHLQLSYASMAKLPAYRRNLELTNYFQVPFNFPFYTAYAEGWGLYAEYLGEEMGLYKDEYEMMGRYSMEIVRACRLVVDTGIHYFNWTKQEAVDYMMRYTSWQKAIVENEINRYITWPGQACAYKIGELKIREFRIKAEEQLGELFDIREFHSIVLQNGPMPMRVLERVIDRWIDKTKQSAKQSNHFLCKNSSFKNNFNSVLIFVSATLILTICTK